MAFFLRDGIYCQGDMEFGDIAVPERPDPASVWNGATWSIPFDVQAAAKIAAIESLRDEKIAAGFSFDASAFGVGTQILQNRGVGDQINWLILQSIAQALISSGNGSVMVKVRTEANIDIEMPASTALALMIAMASKGSSIMNTSWTLKNRVNAVATGDVVGLTAIDITTGWPV